MTGLNMDLRQELSEALLSFHSFGSADQLCSRLLSSKAALASQPTWRRLLSWAGLLRATILAITLTYAVTSMLGEYHYARGFKEHQVSSAIEELRQARAWFPLFHTFREASAIALAGIALKEPDPGWKEAALPELLMALKDDPTSADLLAPTITFEIEMGKNQDAKAHYAMFKRVAKNSPMNGLVK